MRRSVCTIWSNIPENSLQNKPEKTYDEDYLFELKQKLNINLQSDIICIADIGNWYGRCSGYKIVGKNISDCLNCPSDCKTEWFIDNYGDLRGTLIHSFEGTSYYLYRVFKTNLSAQKIQNFTDKIIKGNFTQKDISTYTEKIGFYIKL